MDLIKNIIQIIKKELNEEKILFVIDGYSKKYDKNDSLKKIKELIPKNYLFIIYYCLIYQDSYDFYLNFNPDNNINFYTGFFERYYYYPEIKTIKSLKIENELPKDYYEKFGQNVFYYFEYKKKNIDFSIFVKNLKLKNKLITFLIQIQIIKNF